MANFDFSHVTLNGEKINTRSQEEKDLMSLPMDEFYDRMIKEANDGHKRCMDMYESTKDPGWLDMADIYERKATEWTIKRNLLVREGL